MANKAKQEEKAGASVEYERTQMQKNIIIEKLREIGCRITKQRQILLDVILEENCSCPKEIYYKASQIDKGIGFATVYRMVNMLEEIGAINRKNMYKINCEKGCAFESACTIELEDDTVIELSPNQWREIVQSGLVACGYMKGRNIQNVRHCSSK